MRILRLSRILPAACVLKARFRTFFFRSSNGFRGCGKKRPSPAAKLTPIRIYIGVSTDNFELLQIICRRRARMMHETRLARTAQWANYPGQPLAWIRTYHAYRAYHAPFPSDLPRIPRISRTISVGPYHAYHAYHAPFPSATFAPPRRRNTRTTLSVA